MASETEGLFNGKKSGLIKGMKLNMTSARKDSRMLVYKSLHNWAKIFIHFHRAREGEDCSFGVNE